MTQSNEPTTDQMNSTIALFMGYKKREKLYPTDRQILEGEALPNWYEDSLQYHTSWDWLMPVVEKINQIWVNSVRSKQLQIEETYRAMQNRVLLCSILETVEHVYQFIQRYNQQKQKDGEG